MKIVTWQSVLTEHQVHTLRALQALAGEPIEFVLGARELVERRQQGWAKLELNELSIFELPKLGWWQAAGQILTKFPQAIHLFCGLWADRRFFSVMMRAQMAGITTSLMTEPFADAPVSYFGGHSGLLDRFKAITRPLAYSIGGRLVATRNDSLFAISSKAADQFSAIGFDSDRIFPFGYFVPEAPVNTLNEQKSDSRKLLRLIFVGSLIERKGLRVLLDAIEQAAMAGSAVSLDVYGPGDPSVYAPVPAGVSFKGSINFGEVQYVVAGYDLLVLPSLHDGWGVVVNEALLQGVPVLVSDAVGARTLVDVSRAGQVFPSGQSGTLSRLLVELTNDPQKVASWKMAALSFKPALKPEIAAKYLYECLLYAGGGRSIRPPSPWYL